MRYHCVYVCCSALSESVTVTTDEAPPDAPTNVRILAATTTQLKLGWDPPLHPNGVLKGYYVYNGTMLCVFVNYDKLLLTHENDSQFVVNTSFVFCL